MSADHKASAPQQTATTESGAPDLSASVSSPSRGLNDNQVRRVISTFSYIDGLLNSVERLAGLSGTSPSEFAREQADVSTTEARLLLSLVASARRRMLATLDYLRLPRPTANLSARWSMMTTFRFIDIALSELTPQTLRGYGAIDPEAGAEVSAGAAELRDLIARGREVLQPREGIRLRERLSSITGSYGDVLRAAEALSTELGLIEARPLIAAAADRAETSTIDIGVFGRVSSGKSSLINALIGSSILPVGATPVTAVPLRITHGEPRIDVHLEDGGSKSIDPGSLADYATEAANPDNVCGVHAIHIATPDLPMGIALLDTPGVGSLTQGGSAQTFAWLPRCDLGLVLVAAGTPLGRDELALVTGLHGAGIEVEVLLSKSDLIPADERDLAIAYVRDEIANAIGSSSIVVRPVSVLRSERSLLDEWRARELAPRVAERKRVAEIARARRLHALVSTLDASVKRRAPIERRTLDLHRARLEAERDIVVAAEALENADREALEVAARAVAASWHDGTDALSAARHALLAAPHQALSRVRAAADAMVQHSAGSNAADAASRLPPLFDAPFLDALPISSKPNLWGRAWPRHRALARLAALRAPLHDTYGTYANRVRAWGLERLEENVAQAAALREFSNEDVAPEVRALAQRVARDFPLQNT